VPAAIQLQEQYGGDLSVLFVESQGTEADEMAKFILQRSWHEANALWTTEHPFITPGRSLPKFALVSSDGRIIAQGSGGLTPEHLGLIAAEVEASRR
jgi:hypothetical protein